MTWTATTITIKDAAGDEQQMLAYTDGTLFAFARPVLDNTGAIISPATSGKQDTGNTSLAAIAASVASGSTAAAQATGNTALATIATNTTGVATAAKQDTGNTALASIATNTTGAATAAKQDTGNTSLASLVTNTAGVATSAKQDTGNTSLATIATAVTTIATNSGTEATAALQTTGNTTLASILTACQAATPAGANVIGKVTIDQTTPGTTNLVYLPPPLVITGGTTTRPADTTAYAAGDLVANSTTAGSVTYPTIAAARANDMAGTILRLRLKKSNTSLTNGIFRVHLYNVLPSVTNGDNGSWLTTTAGYQGAFDITMTQAFSDSAMGIGIPTAGSGVTFTPVSGTQNLYYLIEVRAGYTPASAEVFTPYVEIQ